MANSMTWLNKVVRALTGASSSSRQIDFPHDFGIVGRGKVVPRPDGGQFFGSWLTDTVDYYH